MMKMNDEKRGGEWFRVFFFTKSSSAAKDKC